MMSTKIMTAMLALFVASIVCFSSKGGAQTEEPPAKYVAIPSADSSTKKVVDSTKVIREEFVVQKESIKDKVDYLTVQHKRIKETQRQIDSIITIRSVIGVSVLSPQVLR